MQRAGHQTGGERGQRLIRSDQLNRLVRGFAAALTLGAFFAFAPGGATRSAAQEAPSDPRFGIVGGYDAPGAIEGLAVGWEVVPLRWDAFQPGGPGQWNTTAVTEDWVSQAVSEGREVVGVLVGTPAWATDGSPGSGVPTGLYLPVDDPGNLWAGFVRQAASYYAARGVNRIAVWADQDIPPGTFGATWDGSVEDYYRLVQVAYVAAREANPNAVIHLGGAGSNPAWFDTFMDIVADDPDAPASDYYFDVVTVHSLYSPERLYTAIQTPFAVMQAQGIPLKEVWVNRAGARPADDPGFYPEDHVFAVYPNVTLEEQASYVVQAYALGFAANRGSRIAYYRLVDDPAVDNGEGFGLLRVDGTSRPAYEAYRLVVSEFNGFTFARRVEEEAGPTLDYVRFTFETTVKHVVWARTPETATLVIPARSEGATLVNTVTNARQTVTPQDGVYRVVAPGADCDDPPEGCAIGGVPWMLIEEGLDDPINELAPEVTVEPGGVVPTPEGDQVTETPMPTVAPPAPTAGETVATDVPLAATGAAAAPAPTEAPAATPTQANADHTQDGDSGIGRNLLAFGMIGAGILVIGGGVIYFFAGLRRAGGGQRGMKDSTADAEDDRE
jgi:hypothetical protein